MTNFFPSDKESNLNVLFSDAKSSPGSINTGVCSYQINSVFIAANSLDAGNLTQKTEPAGSAGNKVTQYSYDTQNRLIEVNDASNVQASLQTKLIARYGYDPLDRRIWKEQYKSAAGQALAQPLRTYYLYADEGLIAESTQAITLNADGTVTTSAAPQITTQYGPRPNSEFTTVVLFVKTNNSNTQSSFAYLHHDHLQTPLQATDKAGNVVWAASYNAFGKAAIITPAATANNPTIKLNLRLPGQYLDEETGLHYNWHRYYDRETGRYVSQDPIGLRGGINQYLYVRSDPLNLRDPSGEVPWVLIVTIIGGGTSAYKKSLDPCAKFGNIVLAGVGGLITGAAGALVPLGSATRFTSGFIGGAIAGNAVAGYGLSQANEFIGSGLDFAAVAANHDSAVTSALLGGAFGAGANLSGLGAALLNVRSGFLRGARAAGDGISTAVGVLGSTVDTVAQFSPPANAGCGCKK